VVEARLASLAALNFDIPWVINIEKKKGFFQKYKAKTIFIHLHL
jgi:hypothetical protein